MQERLLNHADAEQIATALEDLAEIPRGSNDGDIGELPSHDDGLRLTSVIQKIKTFLDNAFNLKVDKIEGKGLSTNDYTTTEKNKLAGIQSGAQVNAVTSVNGQTGAVTITGISYEECATTSDLPAEGVDGVHYLVPNGQSGENQYDEYVWLSDDSRYEILGPKDIDLSGYVQKEEGKGLSSNDYTDAEKTKLSGIATGAEVNVQADWSESDPTQVDYIKNKPTLGTASALNVAATGNASTGEVVKGDDTRLSDARNAADVYNWAKASTKPSYSYSEISNTPSLGTAAAKNYTTSVTSGSADLVTSGAVSSALASAGGGTWESKTISASGWNSSTATYSFESVYPSASYDILDILPNENTTSAQRNAWIAADCGGYYTTNKIIAKGKIPTIDIPVSICVKAK